MPILASRLAIALLQGIIFGFLSIYKPNYAAGFYLPLYACMIFVPLIVMQGLGNVSHKTLLCWSLIATVMISIVVYYPLYRTGIDPYRSALNITSYAGIGDTLPPVMLFTGIALFIGQALILSSAIDRTFIARYVTYFDIAWKLAIQILFCSFFLSCFALLILLGIGLFGIIHLDFFEKVVTDKWFITIVIPLAVAVALHITDVNVRVVEGFRTLSLILLSWLLPLVTFIISLFLLSLFHTGLAPLWQTGHAGQLLLITGTILILLINATYQDGEKSLKTAQRYSIIFSSYTLIVVTALAIYALSLRVEQYGWSLTRIAAAAWMLIISCYAIGYTLATFFSRSNLSLIAKTNFTGACLMIAVYLALFTPIADPERLAVIDQIHRLEAGKISPEKFDFISLRRNGERYGINALLKLQNSWQGPQINYVRMQAKAALDCKDLIACYTAKLAEKTLPSQRYL